MDRRIPSLTALVLLLLPLLITGCGNGHAIFCAEAHNEDSASCGPAAASAGPECLYATSSSHGGEIQVFLVDHNSGMLSMSASVVGPPMASGITSALNSFLYVSDSQSPTIDAFSIDQTNGTLTGVPGSPFSPRGLSSFSPVALVAGDTALYANDLNGLTAFTISPNGALNVIVGSPYPGGFGGQATLGQSNTTPINYFLYATNSSDPHGTISVFRIVDPASGILTPVPGNFSAGEFSGPSSIVFESALSTPIVFVALKNDSRIAAFAVDVTTGALTPVHGSPFPTGSGPAFLALNAEQNFLYAVNTNNIFAYNIASDGVLTAVSGFPLLLGTQPGSIAITADDYLYVSLPSFNVIEGFRASPVDGGLTPLTSSPFPALGAELLSVVRIPASQ